MFCIAVACRRPDNSLQYWPGMSTHHISLRFLCLCFAWPQVFRRLTRGIELTVPWSVQHVCLCAHGATTASVLFRCVRPPLLGRRGQDVRDAFGCLRNCPAFSRKHVSQSFLYSYKSRRPQSLYIAQTRLMGRRSSQALDGRLVGWREKIHYSPLVVHCSPAFDEKSQSHWPNLIIYDVVPCIMFLMPYMACMCIA